MNTNTKNPNRQKLITAWTEERDASTAALRRADLSTALAHLERAHILSQSMAGPHVRTHLAMLRFAVSNRRPHEVAGLFLLSVLAAPGTWSGRYPLGSTGGPDVSAFAPMAVPKSTSGPSLITARWTAKPFASTVRRVTDAIKSP